MSNPTRIFYFVLTAFFWGCSYLAIGIAIRHTPPFFAAFLRSVVAMTLVAVYLLWRYKKIGLPKLWKQSMTSGLFVMGIAWIFLFWGEKFVTPAMAAILNSTVPIFATILLPFLVPDEKLSRNKVTGVLIGFGGVVLIFWPELSWTVSPELKGLLAVTMMALCYSIGVLWTRRIANRVSNATNLFYQCLGSAIILFLFSAIFELPHQPVPWSWPAMTAIFYLGTCSTAIAWLMFFRLMKDIGSVQATSVTYLIPIVAIVVDHFFWDKGLAWNQLCGALVILSAVFLINYKPGRFAKRSQAKMA